MNRLSTEKRAQVIGWLVEDMSITSEPSVRHGGEAMSAGG